MSAAHLEKGEDEARLALLGELTFETVPGLSGDLESVFKQCPRLRVDLSDIERVDSAGLALLIEWTRLTRALDHSLVFVNMPHQLLAIARVSGVEQMLPFMHADSEAGAGGRCIKGDRS